jgi:phosphatidylinositol alpha-1,6-mannosyltransferase
VSERPTEWFVTQDYAPDSGGIARRHAELCRRFAAAGGSLGGGALAVLTVSHPAATAIDGGEPYAIERLPFPFARAARPASLVRWARATSLRAGDGARLIHCGNLRPIGPAALWAHRTTGVPYLLYVNGLDLNRDRAKNAASRTRRALSRAVYAHAAGVVANSRFTADLATLVMREAGLTKPPPVAAIDLGTDPAQFSPARDRGLLRARFGLGSAPVALTVARLVPHKGQDVAMRAVVQAARAHSALRYVIVGGGPDEARLRALARILQATDRVVFAGQLSDDEIADAYATADVYLGLSRGEGVQVEGFGISLVEAAASGTPSVAGRSGGVSAAVHDGETGFLVEPERVDAAVVALERLLGDDALCARMGTAARLAVETHYNWDRVARETAQFARQVVPRRVQR